MDILFVKLVVCLDTDFSLLSDIDQQHCVLNVTNLLYHLKKVLIKSSLQKKHFMKLQLYCPSTHN